MQLERIKVSTPLILEKKDVDKIAQELRQLKIEYKWAESYPDYWLFSITRQGEIIKCSQINNGHPQIAYNCIYPKDEIFKFIYDHMGYRILPYTLVSVLIGTFQIDGYKGENGNEIYECRYNPFAITYQTSLLQHNLSKFCKMTSTANAEEYDGFGLTYSWQVVFFRNEIMKMMSCKEGWMEYMKSKQHKDERERFVDGLFKRSDNIQAEICFLLGEDVFNQNIDLYDELSKKTGAHGNTIISKLEKMANENNELMSVYDKPLRRKNTRTRMSMFDYLPGMDI